MDRISYQPAPQSLEWHALRLRDITSTEVAALFGMSPYLTEFELYHRKKSPEPFVIKPNERMTWGNRLQDAIAQGVAEERSWRVRPMTEYISVPEIRMGSSFDYRVVSRVPEYAQPEDANGQLSNDGILEIKNVDSLAFRDGWIKDGDHLEAPEHIELQVQHQLEVAGLEWACIAALVGGNKLEYIIRKRDRAVGSALRARVAKFWKQFDANQEPTPDFIKDAETISRLYGYAEPNKVRDARGDAKIAALCARYSELGRVEKAADEERQGIRAELLTLIGDAEKCLADGFSISAGVVGPTRVEYDRAGYRSFRVTAKKEKK